jgi:protein-S-isoprenylcysteine O-methyltransferase Ste14
MTTVQICSFLWTFLGFVWLIGWLWTKRTQERAPLASRLLYGVPVVLAFYLVFNHNLNLGWLDARLFPQNIFLNISAITLTALGIAFAIWARFYLGQNWSSAVSVKIGHELIRTGPYAQVRHPIYSGIILGMIGTALARPDPRGLIAIILLCLAFSIKRRMEEVFMRKTFGPEYDDYSRATGALVPRLRF